ncbi:hypothetical protein [Cytobacillus sp. IB215665]|uniref:hypothetical protein n=1 Tax=Cytobacillus sp. IB215665 TaxID=3097357 RepID=UPI002A161FF9|nr:hypothetical protein [Cytobacillus sp. IB215665]MDX8364911.1 hypothetical protein [Cytobacillus sp. IB215665]
MKQVMKSLKRSDNEQRLAVLRLELDYELLTLYEAIVEKNVPEKNECLKRLEQIREELVSLGWYK